MGGKQFSLRTGGGDVLYSWYSLYHFWLIGFHLRVDEGIRSFQFESVEGY